MFLAVEGNGAFLVLCEPESSALIDPSEPPRGVLRGVEPIRHHRYCIHRSRH
jgi:hypothetical protein